MGPSDIVTVTQSHARSYGRGFLPDRDMHETGHLRCPMHPNASFLEQAYSDHTAQHFLQVVFRQELPAAAVVNIANA